MLKFTRYKDSRGFAQKNGSMSGLRPSRPTLRVLSFLTGTASWVTVRASVSDLLLSIDIFAAGAVVMALEIMGSRILAPYFGNSVYVWGSLIGVVLTFLSMGYYLGGRIADMGPSFERFSLVLLAAGIFILTVPSVAPGAFEIVFNLGLGERYGPLLASLVILAPPTILLGMVSPYAVKLGAKSLEHLGGVAGNIYALSTIGSIAGTFVTVFVLIPIFTVRTTIEALGILLIGASALGLSKRVKVLAVLAIIILAFPTQLILSGFSAHSGNVIYEKDTPYSHLDVTDAAGVRTLYLNGLRHSGMFLNGSNNPAFAYTGYFNAAFLFNSNLTSVLFVGGGGFSGPKQFLADYPDVSVDVVEIDPDVVDVAKRYFNVVDDPRLTIYVDDGRAFLARTSETYDLVVLDAYSKTYVPFHLMTYEFFAVLRDHLSPTGLLVSNLITSMVGDTSDLFWAEYRTVSQLFPSLHIFRVSDSGDSTIQNTILVATKSRFDASKDELRRLAAGLWKVRVPGFSHYPEHLYTGTILASYLPLLRDDYAPVEELLNPVTGQPLGTDEGLVPATTIRSLVVVALWLVLILAVSSVVYWKGFRRKIVNDQVSHGPANTQLGLPR